MAIDDIVARIGADAADEAAAIIAEATAAAALLTGEASARAEAEASSTLARESAAARRDAETILANARLEARDAMLSARLALDEEALSAVGASIVALPDERYATLIARGVAASSIDDEIVLVGTADMARLRTALPAALAAAGSSLSVSDVPADIERGAVLVSDRVRVEVSPAAMVAGERDPLMSEADGLLFGQEA